MACSLADLQWPCLSALPYSLPGRGGGSIEGIHLLQAQTFWLIKCAFPCWSHAIHRLTHMHANVSFVWTRDGGACFPYIHST